MRIDFSHPCPQPTALSAVPNSAVLMLAYYFPPRGGSGVQRSQKFAKYLPEFGWDPVVVTTTEDDITQERDESLLAEISTVPVYRVPSTERLLKKLARLKLGPLVSLVLRPDAHCLWKGKVLHAASELISRHRCRALYVSVQPWSAALLGLALKRRHQLPLIVDFRDPWTPSTSKAWPTVLHHSWDARLEERVFREADGLISVTPGIVDRYRALYPGARDKIHLLPNGYDAADFPASDRQPVPPAGLPLTIGFSGRLYSCREPRRGGIAASLRRLVEHRNVQTDFTTHSLRYFLRALAKLVERDPATRDAIRLELAGPINPDNFELAKQLGLDRMIVSHGVLPHSQALDMMRACDVAFLPMMTETDGRRSANLSGKIFEYLALRIPILAAVPEGDAADLVRAARAGWIVQGNNVAELGALLSTLVASKREGSLRVEQDRAVIDQYERRRLTRRLAALLDRLVPPPADLPAPI